MLARMFSKVACSSKPTLPNPYRLAMSPNACEPVSFKKNCLAPPLTPASPKNSTAESINGFRGPDLRDFCMPAILLSTSVTPSLVAFKDPTPIDFMDGANIAMIAESAASSAEPMGLVSMPTSPRT